MSDQSTPSMEESPISAGGISPEETPISKDLLKQRSKKVQFPELAEIPYWGKKNPETEHWYTDADGENLFVVGRFTHPGSYKEDFIASFFNGEEWVKKVPSTWDSSRPLYNMVSLWNEEQKAQTADVVIVQDEYKADRLDQFFQDNRMPYIVTTWCGGMKGIRKTSWDQGLRHRNVILWPSNDDFSHELFEVVKGCISPIVETLREVEHESGQGWGCLQAIKSIEEGSWGYDDMRVLLHSSKEVALVTPATEVNELGIGHLETFVPLGFIEKMKEDFGEYGKNGKKYLKSNYISAMRVVENDPAFFDCVKYDESISDIVWDKSKYPTIDDFKNAILRRLTIYGISATKSVRDDITQTMSNDPKRRINTIRSMMDELCTKHMGAGPDAIDELLKHIEFDTIKGIEAIKNGLPSEEMYKKAFELFFTKATMRIYTAYSSNPITNDVVPVFVGRQGVGKTRLCKYLAMREDKYVDLGNKAASFGSPDWIRHIMGMFIAELGEMHVMRKSEVETIKSGISEVYDSLTPKYKEGVKKVPRTVSFVGTSNETEFLRDLSGNRRFFPIRIRGVDHEYLFAHPEIIERVWAYYYSNIRSVMSDYDASGKLLPFANQPPTWMIKPDQGLVDYYRLVNESSTDMGMHGDLICDAIAKIESEQGGGRHIRIKLLDLAERVYGSGGMSSAKDEFRKKARWYLEKYGYELLTTNEGDMKVRVFSISTNSPSYISRASGRFVQPMEW